MSGMFYKNIKNCLCCKIKGTLQQLRLKLFKNSSHVARYRITSSDLQQRKAFISMYNTIHTMYLAEINHEALTSNNQEAHSQIFTYHSFI